MSKTTILFTRIQKQRQAFGSRLPLKAGGVGSECPSSLITLTIVWKRLKIDKHLLAILKANFRGEKLWQKST